MKLARRMFVATAAGHCSRGILLPGCSIIAFAIEQ
jgi:hypothetical protein